MTTEEYQIGYSDGYDKGWNDAIDDEREKPNEADKEFANAQLIAAAPELLEACKKFVVAFSILDDGPDASDEAHAKDMLVEALKMARAAIAKTEDIAFRRFNPKTRSYE